METLIFMKVLGHVVSHPEPPNTQKVWFVIKNNVHKNQFVKIGNRIARISEIYSMNDLYKNAEIVSQIIKREENLKEFLDTENYNYSLAQAIILGDLNNSRNIYPPKPGDEVLEIEEEKIEEFLGLDKNGLHIGDLEFHKLKVKLDVDKLFKKHLAILAMSGAGKSYLASVLIEELLKMEKKPLIIVFDPHGEYIGFKKSVNFAKNTTVISKEEIKIPVWDLSPFDFKSFVPEMSGAQIRELKRVLEEIKNEKKLYDLEEIIERVESTVQKKNIRDALISWLTFLARFKILGKDEYPTLSFLNNCDLVVFDISEILDIQEKQIAVYYFLKKIFQARIEKSIKPVIFFIEEAHQFAPQQALIAISKQIIERIAREGRKFNTSLVLISQRPVNLSTTALSQCNTQIILRVTNPNDLDQIKKSAESMSSDFISMLPSLKVGEAIISGEAVNQPVLIKVRKRESTKEEKWLSFKEELEKFEKISKEDVKAFL